jgi:hypothetical protein
LRNRVFRNSLVCHAERRPSWTPSPQSINRLRVRCRVELLDTAAVGVGESERFRLDGRTVLDTADPITKHLLLAGPPRSSPDPCCRPLSKSVLQSILINRVYLCRAAWTSC